jgi:molecular chaperone DnaK
VPQVEVTFDIDANGILSVSAVDKATGKEQSIKIQASSGLSDEEVERMVSDADVHAEEDKKKREMIDLRNEAEARIHSARKSMEDLGDDLDAALKEDVETKITALEEVLKGDDPEMIRAASDALMTAVQQLASAAYEKASAAQGESETGEAGQAKAENAAADEPGKEGPVDADYEVVED